LFVEALAEGLGAGLVSTGVMVLFEFPFWKAGGMAGVVEWQVNQILVSKVLREEYNESTRLLPALGMHFLHGMVARGILAVVLASFLLQFAWYFWAFGILFSFFLWMLVPFALRREFETAGRIRFTRSGILVSLVSHLIYGLILGIILQISLE
jgi:tellurite resistance protein TehA-like permease